MNLTKKEVEIKMTAGRDFALRGRREAQGTYDPSIGLAIEYIFMAAKHAKKGDFEQALTCARLAHDFQA